MTRETQLILVNGCPLVFTRLLEGWTVTVEVAGTPHRLALHPHARRKSWRVKLGRRYLASGLTLGEATTKAQAVLQREAAPRQPPTSFL